MSARGPWAYRALLRLLPSALRARQGAAMADEFAAAVSRARAAGLGAWLRAWVAGALDVVRRALYERVRIVIRLRGSRPLTSFGHDLRFAFRGFLRQPAITFLSVLMLALGVAASTAVFSLVHALFVRPLPFPASERLVNIDETAPRWNLEYTGVDYDDFDAWRRNAETFEAMGLIDPGSYNVADARGAERISGAQVTHDYDDALGVRPVLGRGFTAEEDAPGGSPVILIGHGLWQRRFAGAADVVGRTLRVDGVERTIVGVLPPEGSFPGGIELWLPLAETATPYNNYEYTGVGRLAPGVSLESARADLLRAHAPIWAERDTAHTVTPVLLPLRDRFVTDYRAVAIALAIAVMLVLVIACANVAAILLARAFARRRELGIRVAIGADAARLARQLFTESLALAVVAAPFGLALGFLGVRLLIGTVERQLPGFIRLEPDWVMALFGLALVVATTVLFGWAPVVQARNPDVRDALGEGSGRTGAPRAHRRTMDALVVAEVTLAALLLVSGGLLLRAFDSLRNVDPGFRTENVLTFRVALPELHYPDSAARLGFYVRLLERLETLPGVRAAGAISCPPLGGCHSGSFFVVEGEAPPAEGAATPVVLRRMATPGYFEAMDIRLAAGRFFDEADRRATATPVVVVNETFVRELMGSAENPIGRRLRYDWGEETWFTIVGVARDVQHYGLDRPMRPGLYFPLEASVWPTLALVAWTAVTPISLLPAVREVVRDLDPELPLFTIATTDETVRNSLAVRRAYSLVMATFAAMALLLALGGIYGVLSYVVGQRSREIAVRLAVGATRRDVVRLVVRQGLALALAGTALGFLIAVAAGRALSSLLADFSARDPLTFAAAGALLITTALLSALAPARRALKVEPQAMLRNG